jgi:hypothetical protein
MNIRKSNSAQRTQHQYTERFSFFSLSPFLEILVKAERLCISATNWLQNIQGVKTIDI